STVRGWMHTRDYFVNKCLEIAKIASEGKLNYFLGEVTMEKAEENPVELAKECGIKVDKVSKKTVQGNQAGSRKNRRETDNLLQNSKHKPKKLLRFS
ncbi:MAG: hypothetical protein PUJ82_07145, partial [Spirochaetales bacterium]|nr:hypothetical protein [Spirochaetales bacterium]MDY5914925.1 hypothetical protein [Treponema sp.]